MDVDIRLILFFLTGKLIMRLTLRLRFPYTCLHASISLSLSLSLVIRFLSDHLPEAFNVRGQGGGNSLVDYDAPSPY